MNSKQKKLDTDDLIDILQVSPSFKHVMESFSNSFDNSSLGSHLLNLLSLHGCTPSEIIQKTNLSKSFLYQILNGTRAPGRDILIRIAFAAGLSLDQTQRLLAIAKRGTLYPRIRRDAAIIFCLNKHHSLDEVNELLESEHEIPLLRGEEFE